MKLWGGAIDEVQITDGTDFAALTLPADGRTGGDEALEVVNFPLLFNGTTYDRMRAAGSASPLIGAIQAQRAVDMVVVEVTGINDSDQRIAVPANTQYRFVGATFTLGSTATVGNRYIEFSVLDDSGNIVYVSQSPVAQAASLTRRYNCFPGAGRDTAFANTRLQLPFGFETWLEPAYELRIFDNAAVAATADDLTGRALFETRAG